MFLAIGAAAVGLLFGPIGSALARRIAGRSEPGDAAAEIEELRARMTAEVDDLRSRALEVEDLRNRLAEVEERVDFAERLLTRPQDSPAPALKGDRQ
jgi:hypothetical protein